MRKCFYGYSHLTTGPSYYPKCTLCNGSKRDHQHVEGMNHLWNYNRCYKKAPWTPLWCFSMKPHLNTSTWWKTRLLAPWCGHGYTFSSSMCAFLCIFHLWNIHTAGYFNTHDIHLGPYTLFQIVWRLDERAFTVRHHEAWPPSLFSPLSNCLIKTLRYIVTRPI